VRSIGEAVKGCSATSGIIPFIHVMDGLTLAPKTGEIIRQINARQPWQRILETRLHTGEPYLLFIDTVNRSLPKHARELGLKVSSSNLCSEIVLPTGLDHRDEERTAVCCRRPGTNGAGCPTLSKTCCGCSTTC
jgi:hypothetical protein